MPYSSFSKLGAGSELFYGLAGQAVSISNASDVATVTLTGHGLVIGQYVEVTGVDAAFEENAGLKKIVSVPDSNSFTYAATGADDGSVTAAAGEALEVVSFTELEQADAIGETGGVSNFQVSRRMRETTNRYIKGISDTPDKDLVCAHEPGNAAYAAFIVYWDSLEAAAGSLRFLLVSTVGDTALYSVAVGTRRMSQPGEEELMMTFAGKQTGEVQWGEDA